MSNGTHTAQTLWHTLAVKFLAAVLMGLIVEALLIPMRSWEPVRALKYLGEDVVFSARPRFDPPPLTSGPSYVFVDIDEETVRNWKESSGHDDIRAEIVNLMSE